MRKFFFDKNKTFKPKKAHKKGTTRYNLHQFAKPFVQSGDLRSAVRCPEGYDEDSWLCVQTTDFYNITNVLYGSITEFCTNESCPRMSAGPKYEYRWRETGKKKPEKLSAPEYIERLMTWIEETTNDEKLFPEEGQPFPKDFKHTVADIMRRLFRVYAHVYYFHFTKIQELGEESHLNTAFKHFYLFCMEYNLITPEEVEPMRDLVVNMMGPEYLIFPTATKEKAPKEKKEKKEKEDKEKRAKEPKDRGEKSDKGERDNHGNHHNDDRGGISPLPNHSSDGHSASNGSIGSAASSRPQRAGSAT